MKKQLKAKHPQRDETISLPTDAELQALRDAIDFREPDVESNAAPSPADGDQDARQKRRGVDRRWSGLVTLKVDCLYTLGGGA